MIDAVESPAGLCGACRYARRVESVRGSGFWLCARSADDPRFARYPRLPVLECRGYASSETPPDAPRGA